MVKKNCLLTDYSLWGKSNRVCDVIDKMEMLKGNNILFLNNGTSFIRTSNI